MTRAPGTPAPTTPALSVALSVYNAQPYLALAIESVCAQSFADFEFLILDDGSTDASRAIAEGYAARDPRIRVIARENRGFVASLNQLIEEARAPLIARMDADDICLPGRFAAQLDFLAANPGHGVIGTDVFTIDADGLPCARPPILRPLSHEALVANLESGPLLNHNAVIMDRALLLDVGGYRPAFTHAEDYDLWLRLSSRTRLANLPDKLVGYRIYPDQVSSRHLIAQTRHAAIAWLCHRERLAGRADPMADARALPDDADLDRLFEPGAAAIVRRRVVARALYAADALAGDGWDMLLVHAHDNRADAALWRLAARMLAGGMPVKAGRLGLALLAA